MKALLMKRGLVLTAETTEESAVLRTAFHDVSIAPERKKLTASFKGNVPIEVLTIERTPRCGACGRLE